MVVDKIDWLTQLRLQFRAGFVLGPFRSSLMVSFRVSLKVSLKVSIKVVRLGLGFVEFY